MGDTTSIGEQILDTVELRRLYDAKRPQYDRLLHLVSLILNAAIEKNKIKIDAMKYRVKDYESFLEKVERKRYIDPFRQCTDLAGCRIICLFQSQVEQLRDIIEKEFEILEVSDKKNTKKFDQFGYLSLHMLIKLPKSRVGFTECTGLDELVCEVQVRTILQEAWAEIEHYLNYKTTKEEKNEELLRKIFSLAGMFEVADSTFEEIQKGFRKMVEHKSDRDSITALNLYRFSRDYFKWYNTEWSKKEERSFIKLSEESKKINLRNVSELRKILDKHHKMIDKYEDYHKNKEKHSGRFFSPVGLIRAAFALEFGQKFDLAFGIRGYSDKVRKECERIN